MMNWDGRMNFQNGGMMNQYDPNRSVLQNYGYGPNQNVASMFNQPFQQAQLAGRIIRNPNEIMASEVPMDGRISLFPMEDYSSIYAKTWGPDGTIRAVRYVPEAQEPVKTISEGEDLKSFLTDRMDKLETLIMSAIKPSTKKGGASNDESR